LHTQIERVVGVANLVFPVLPGPAMAVGGRFREHLWDGE